MNATSWKTKNRGKLKQTFTNDLGEQQKLFTAAGQQLFRPEMFADMADPAFYKQFAQSDISRPLSTGLIKELKDSGIDLKNGAIDLTKVAVDNPGLVFGALWNAVKGLPGEVKDSFVETGHAIGEGSAVAFNNDISKKLDAIYGNDVSGYQEAMLAIRTISALTGAAGVAKAGGGLTETTAKAVSKKLDEVATIRAEAKNIANRMQEIAIHKDDTRFFGVAEKMAEAEKAGWKTSDGKIWWPPENGKVPGTEQLTQLQVGQRLDRFGGTGKNSREALIYSHHWAVN